MGEMFAMAIDNSEKQPRRELEKLAARLRHLEAEHERTVLALQEAEAQLHNLFDLAAVGIAHVSPEGRFLRINQRFCDIVHRKIAVFEGKIPHDAQKFPSLLKNARHGNHV